MRDRAETLLTDFPDAFRDARGEVGTVEAADVWTQASPNIAEHTTACMQQLSAVTEAAARRTSRPGDAE